MDSRTFMVPENRRIGFGRRDSYSSEEDGGDDGGGYVRQERLWSQASSGQGGDLMYGSAAIPAETARRRSSNLSRKKGGLLISEDRDYMMNCQDLVEQIAQEKEKKAKLDKRRRRCYQLMIFSICFTLAFLNKLREQYIDLVKSCWQKQVLVGSSL